MAQKSNRTPDDEQWVLRRDLAEERALTASLRTQLAAATERYERAVALHDEVRGRLCEERDAARALLLAPKGYDFGEGWMVCRSVNPSLPGWLVSFTDSPDEEADVFFLGPDGLLSDERMHAFDDVPAAFAALAAARKEVP